MLRSAQHDRGGKRKCFNEMFVQNSFSRHNVGSMHPRTVGRPLRRTPVYPRLAFQSNAVQEPRPHRAFTLIELLIAIIAILIGLLFPAFKAVQNQARQTQTKNDLTQIVNAVNAYYTEYGNYPLPPMRPGDFIYGATTVNVTTTRPADGTSNFLFNELRACTATDPSCSAAAVLNTRQIVFISPPVVKNPAQPRSGIGTTTGQGQYFDPWGTPYNVEIDGDYTNNITANPYGNNNGAGPSPVAQGVIAWSLGTDQALGTAGVSTSFTNSDDVISWQ
jgi:prepilin-type N-terminal cleavage/methylation domain-containing protein